MRRGGIVRAEDICRGDVQTSLRILYTADVARSRTAGFEFDSPPRVGLASRGGKANGVRCGRICKESSTYDEFAKIKKVTAVEQIRIRFKLQSHPGLDGKRD